MSDNEFALFFTGFIFGFLSKFILDFLADLVYNIFSKRKNKKSKDELDLLLDHERIKSDYIDISNST